MTFSSYHSEDRKFKYVWLVFLGFCLAIGTLIKANVIITLIADFDSIIFNDCKMEIITHIYGCSFNSIYFYKLCISKSN